MRGQPLIERFMSKVSKDSQTGCWNFTSSISKSGNGRIFLNGKCQDAYRVSYELFVGDIPKGTDLHHLCENRACVNPEHLKPLNRRDHLTNYSPNHVAYKNAHKTHCPQGHELTENNLVQFRFKKSGGRICLICARKRSRDCQSRKRNLKSVHT